MIPPSYSRILLQEQDDDAARTLRSPTASFTATSPFDSSLVLIILILLTVLFFMAFFSLAIRRFSNTATSSDGSESIAGRRARVPRTRLFNKRDGVDTSTIESLPKVSFGGDSNVWNECSICLSEFEERETVKVIPYCGHGFHPVCIEMWLSSHVSCPLCRSTQLLPAVDEVRTGTGKISDGGD